eukprot:SAG31_NODE_960_length_10753_cov_7.843064_4_plen_129_part_00
MYQQSGAVPGYGGYGTAAGAPAAGDDLYSGFNDYNQLMPQAPEGTDAAGYGYGGMPPGTGVQFGRGPSGMMPPGTGMMAPGAMMPPGTAMRGMMPPGTGMGVPGTAMRGEFARRLAACDIAIQQSPSG